ncbi:MAG: type II toxin-antitoxin system HicB family antitoxin [Actinomycetota bacterium]
MNTDFKAVVKQEGDWWIGWVEEIPGVNSQGKSREELMTNLTSALQEALQMNRESALDAAGDGFEEVTIST